MQNEFLKDGKYFEIYQRIFQLHKTHANIHTPEEWAAFAEAAGEFEGDFERALVHVVISEIEKERNHDG